MTVNVKLVFMVMAISIVFMTNYAKSKNVMKMRIVNHLKDSLFVLVKKVFLVMVITFARPFVPPDTGRDSWTSFMALEVFQNFD